MINQNLIKRYRNQRSAQNVFIHLKKLTESIEALEEENKTLRRKIEEYNKDEEISLLKENIENIKKHSLYLLSEESKKRKNKFEEKHKKSCNNNPLYRLTGTALGTAIEIICEKCGTTENVTDYNQW